MHGTLFFYHFIRILFYIKVKLTFRSTYYLFNNYRLIHGHFHIGLVIIPRPPYWPETQSRPIWVEG